MDNRGLKNSENDFYVFKENNGTNFEELVLVANIVSDGDVRIVDDVKELVFEYDNFCEKRKEFCANIVENLKDIANIKKYLPIFFGYWISGVRPYNNKLYCTYVGWDMKAGELLESVQKILDSRKIDLYVMDLTFVNDKVLEDVFSTIDEFLKANYYSLLKLEVEKNTFFLFVVSVKESMSIKNFGYNMNLDFNDDFN